LTVFAAIPKVCPLRSDRPQNGPQEHIRLFHRIILLPGTPLLLASASPIRLHLLQQAGLDVTAIPARVDEDGATAALRADGATPRDVADALAELKARKIAERYPTSLVLGCDQVLALRGQLLVKPASPEDAIRQLSQMQDQTHDLYSALVLYEEARPIWRHIGEVRMRMRPLSPADIAAYVTANWPGISDAVGGYKIEAAGRALFSAIPADTTAIQGLPLPPLLGYLAQRGFSAE
jgi:septum formation protein